MAAEEAFLLFSGIITPKASLVSSSPLQHYPQAGVGGLIPRAVRRGLSAPQAIGAPHRLHALTARGHSLRLSPEGQHRQQRQEGEQQRGNTDTHNTKRRVARLEKATVRKQGATELSHETRSRKLLLGKEAQ